MDVRWRGSFGGGGPGGFERDAGGGVGGDDGAEGAVWFVVVAGGWGHWWLKAPWSGGWVERQLVLGFSRKHQKENVVRTFSESAHGLDI